MYSTKLFLLQRYSTMPSSIFSAFNAKELKVANPSHYLYAYLPSSM